MILLRIGIATIVGSVLSVGLTHALGLDATAEYALSFAAGAGIMWALDRAWA